jgi:hypothetical protein
MRALHRILLVCGFVLAAANAPAEEAIDADARIAQIRESSRTLALLAAEPLPAFESADERQAAEAWRTFVWRAANDLDALATEWESARLTDRSGTTAAGDPQQLNATRQMQEMNASFNLQYLSLQQKLQDESRRFRLLSNIMKTKHDTAKNAINTSR